MNVKNEVDTIKQALEDDSEYAWGWHCNIAMIIYDSINDHNASNLLASKIMKRIWDVDTSQNEHYKQIMNQHFKICDSKVNGLCTLPNIYCQYPKCEKL